jgi:hypothetical protein
MKRLVKPAYKKVRSGVEARLDSVLSGLLFMGTAAPTTATIEGLVGLILAAGRLGGLPEIPAGNAENPLAILTEAR